MGIHKLIGGSVHLYTRSMANTQTEEYYHHFHMLESEKGKIILWSVREATQTQGKKQTLSYDFKIGVSYRLHSAKEP